MEARITSSKLIRADKNGLKLNLFAKNIKKGIAEIHKIKIWMQETFALTENHGKESPLLKMNSENLVLTMPATSHPPTLSVWPKFYKSQLHILHITTEKQLGLFESSLIEEKNIRVEVCVHNLWFSDQDCPQLGNLIKCNPSIKKPNDRDALIQALHNNRIDIIATNHAPHTLEEKQIDFERAPIGTTCVIKFI